MRILITGATGLIGSKITELFQDNGIEVNYLTTSRSKIEKSDNNKGFYWNPSKGEIDTKCLEGVGAIINLAGASVFQPWTSSNKKKILKSRIDSLDLLYKTLQENEHEVGQLVSASAIGIYSSSTHKMHYEEEQEVADNFLGEVSEKWEIAAQKFSDLGLRVAIVRIGVVLAKDGGALPQIARPIKFNAGTSLGSGQQWQSWIHVKDLARLFLFLISTGAEGVFNGVAPNPVTNEDLTREVARVMEKKLWLPKVPAFALKLVMGEMASVVLGSQLVSSKKVEDAGFDFLYVNLRQAINDIYK
ncbi:TIGR01777 family protein [Salinimicrobium sp. CDJ15-81-2]|nr:TIGR01777 family protein [Salinimicrobium nanhaiense]